MDPATALLAAQAASSMLQAYNSEQGRQMDAKARAELKDMIDKIQDPKFDVSTITPQQFKVIGKYSPQVAPYIAEKNPTLLKETAVSQEGKNAQLSALRNLQNTATTGSDPMQQALMEGAARNTQAEAQSRQASLLQDAVRRGQSGTLATLASQMGGNEAAMTRNAEANRQAAIQAYQNKLSAMRDSANLGGTIANQDINMQKSNADIINQFNQRMAGQQNQYGQYAANQSNDAQMKNLAAAQEAANANVSGANSAAWQNRQMQNSAQQNAFQNALNRVGVQGGMYQTNAAAQAKNIGDQNQMLQSLPNMYGAYSQGEEAKKGQIFQKTGNWESPEDYMARKKQQGAATDSTGAGYGGYA